MENAESILKKAMELPPEQRLQIARALLEQSLNEQGDSEASVGERGLASLTESTLNEDWSEFYPKDLKQRKVG